MGNCSVCHQKSLMRQEVIDLLLGRFYEDFANVTSAIILEKQAVAILYDVATTVENELPKSDNEKLMFRAAYCLETIYFSSPQNFYHYNEKFCRDFSLCANESAKRHFTKIMSHLLISYQPLPDVCSAIAEACAQWAIQPKTRVAVVIGAIEVMLRLRGRVEWLDETLDEILEMVERNPSRGMEVRLKRWNRVRTM